MKMMRSLRVVIAGTAIALGFGAVAVDAPSLSIRAALAGPEKAPAKGPKGKEKPVADAPVTKKGITVQPSELAWGIDKKKLHAIYDKVIDEDYKARYKKVQPGPELDRLDAEVNEKKSEFKRSQIDFGNVPTGMDSTPLKPEYSYNNKEFLLSIDRGGKTRYFFFINDRLWKIVDALKLGEKSPWGKTFDEAVGILNKHYGADGRTRQADDAAGRPNKEVDWKDSTSQVRAIDWGDSFAIAFQDSATVAQLPSLRKNTLSNAKDIDAKVKDAGRKEPPPPDPKDKKPKGK